MNKLYRFFFILFCAFVAISFVYATLVIWLDVKIILSTKFKGMEPESIRVGDAMKVGIVQAMLYGLALLLITIYLFHRSYQYGQRYTVKDIIRMTGWFFLVTTIVNAIYILAFPSMTAYTLLSGTVPRILPPALWFPFPLAWLSLLAILAMRIKKTE